MRADSLLGVWVFLLFACSSSSTNPGAGGGGTTTGGAGGVSGGGGTGGGTGAVSGTGGASGGTGGASGGTGGASGGAAGAGGSAGSGGGAPCDLGKQFGTPVSLPINTTASETAPRISTDGLTLYFTYGTSGDTDLHYATRGKITDEFSNPQKLPGAINTASYEEGASPANDDLELFFDRGPQFSGDIYVATRGSKSGDFSLGDPITILNSTWSEGPGNLSLSETVLYFTSNRGSGDWRLFRAERVAGAFKSPVELSEINTPTVPEQDVSPVVTPDDRVLYFSSNRTGSNNFDIYVAKRPSPGNSFADVKLVGELNGTATSGERPGSITPDGCTIYFESNRAGSFDIYRATKPE